MTSKPETQNATNRLDRCDDTRAKRGDVADLRANDASKARDRSSHRKAAWLYEDLLN